MVISVGIGFEINNSKGDHRAFAYFRIKKPKFLNYKYQIIMMSKVTKLEEYKFFKEDRTLQELLITNRLTQLLTDANLRRVS